MTRTDLSTYTPEFRAEAVKLVLEHGPSLEVTAQRLSVPKGTLANWVTEAKRGSTASTSAPASRSVAGLEAENAKLRRELAVERMEKEALKRPGHAQPVIATGHQVYLRVSEIPRSFGGADSTPIQSCPSRVESKSIAGCL